MIDASQGEVEEKEPQHGPVLGVALYQVTNTCFISIIANSPIGIEIWANSKGSFFEEVTSF